MNLGEVVLGNKNPISEAPVYRRKSASEKYDFSALAGGGGGGAVGEGWLVGWLVFCTSKIKCGVGVGVGWRRDP